MLNLPRLTTSRLTLRPFSLGDAADVQRLAGAWEIADTTSNIPHPYEDGMAEVWIAGHGEAFKSGEQVTLAISLTGGELIGAMGLILEQGYQAELGYWIGRPYWGQGYCTEAGTALVNYAFDELGLQRIHARAFRRNPASSRILRKLGMSLEGIQRQAVLKWGKPEDIELYGILKEDSQ